MKQSWTTQFKRTPSDKRTHNGILFASLGEMKCWQRLEWSQEQGTIKNLERQIRYPLILPNGVPIKTPSGRTMVYTPDFRWNECDDGRQVIAEYKGFQDKLSAMRIAIFEAIYCVKVHVIRK